MSPTAECKSIIVKILHTEKQGSDLFIIFFTLFDAEELMYGTYIDMK